jgi:hypothetical protein
MESRESRMTTDEAEPETVEIDTRQTKEAKEREATRWRRLEAEIVTMKRSEVSRKMRFRGEIEVEIMRPILILIS